MEENAQKKQLEKGEKDKECAIGINVSLSLTNIRGFLKQQNKEEEKKQECNAQKIERLCEMTAQAFFLLLPTSFAPPLCTAKNLICKEKAKSIPSKSQICLERPSFSQYFLVKSARRQRRLELPKSLSAPVNVLRPDQKHGRVLCVTILILGGAV